MDRQYWLLIQYGKRVGRNPRCRDGGEGVGWVVRYLCTPLDSEKAKTIQGG